MRKEIRVNLFTTIQSAQASIKVAVKHAEKNFHAKPEEVAFVMYTISSLQRGGKVKFDWKDCLKISKMELGKFESEPGVTVLDLVELHHELCELLNNH